MLVCVMLATAAFVTYTARMDWKRAAEEVSALPVTKETTPETILSAPPTHPPLKLKQRAPDDPEGEL